MESDHSSVVNGKLKGMRIFLRLLMNGFVGLDERTGYYGDESIIEKVIVDGDKDITFEVKVIDEAPLT
jgi:hypothetical protein